MDKNRITLAIALCGAATLSGCGGDSSSSESGSAPSPEAEQLIDTYDVRAIDGYLRNAKVWLDLNEDCLHDVDTEPYAMSGEGGLAQIDVTGISEPDAYPIVVSALAGKTIDEDSPNEPISKDIVLTAPAGERAATPLSTMVQLYLQEASQGVTDPLQLEQLKKQAVIETAGQFGIAPEQVLGDFIAQDIVEVAFVARSLVETSLLPSSPEALQESMQAAKEGESNLEKNLSVVANMLKDTIESMPVEQLINSPSPLGGQLSDADRDLDGVPDALDAFPDDPNEFINTDDDDIGNSADLDDDNDGYLDDKDTYPTDARRAGDHDGDGIDSIDDPYPFDYDNDTYPDDIDQFDDDPNEWLDTDGDGIGDNSDLYPNDFDNDSYPDSEDAFDRDSSEWIDTDLDGIGNNADTDDDNDSYSDEQDNDPLVALVTPNDYQSCLDSLPHYQVDKMLLAVQMVNAIVSRVYR